MTTLNKTDRRPASAPTVVIIALTVLLVANCAFVANRLWHHDNSVTLENHLIENTQVFFLLLATCLHTWQARAQRAHGPAASLCHMVLAMLCLSIMVREIDIDRLGPQAGWQIAENLIRLIGVAAWLWLLTHVSVNRGALWRQKAEVLRTSASVLTGVGVLLYMASWFFDKSVVPMPENRSQLWEETLQMSGTICLFMASVRPLPLQQP